MYEKKREGVYMDAGKGRLVCHKDGRTTYYWSSAMLDYLRRRYPTTLNEELAVFLGVSTRTMIRKARELGLEKNPVWLSAIWDERRKIAHIVHRCKGYPGSFQKGQRANPAGEFKPGHRLTPEQEAKRAASLREWYRAHPGAASARVKRQRNNKTTRQQV